jgi:hypothetical protein
MVLTLPRYFSADCGSVMISVSGVTILAMSSGEQ